MPIFKESDLKPHYELKELLWYIIPGATLVLTIFLFEYWLATQIQDIYKINDANDTTYIRNVSKQDSIKLYKLLSATIKQDSIGNKNNTVENYIKNFVPKAWNIWRKNPKLYSDSIIAIKKQLRDSINTPVFTAITMTYVGEKIPDKNWVISSLYVLLLLSICFILGHITYMIGTFVYERGLIMKGYGYPYIKLLKLRENRPVPKTEQDICAEQRFYRGIYFWAGFSLIGFYFSFKYWGHIHFDLYIAVLLLAIVFFFMLPIRFKFLFDNLIELENGIEECMEIYKERESINDSPSVEEKEKIETFRKLIEIYKNRPVKSGYFYWPICGVILIIVMQLVKFDIRNIEWLNFLTKPVINFNNILEQFCEKDGIYGLTIPFWQKGFFYFEFWIIIVGIFICIEWVIRSSFLSTKISNMSVKLILREKQLSHFVYKTNSRYERLKVICASFFIKIYNFAGNEIDKFSRHYLHVQDTFDPDFINTFDEAFRIAYKKSYILLSRHAYWLSKFYITEKSNQLTLKINFWENTYRFAKSLAAAFLIAFIYCGLRFMTAYNSIENIFKGHSGIVNQYIYTVLSSIDTLFSIPIAYFVITILIMQYYLYVYDNRYHRIVLRSFVTVALAEKKDSPVSNL